MRKANAGKSNSSRGRVGNHCGEICLRSDLPVNHRPAMELADALALLNEFHFKL